MMMMVISTTKHLLFPKDTDLNKFIVAINKIIANNCKNNNKQNQSGQNSPVLISITPFVVSFLVQNAPYDMQGK